MKPVNVCLSKSEISALLSSDLPPDETVSAEQHIADCETCRAMIESMIGDSRWWNDAQQSLAAFFMRNRPEADVSHEAEPTTSEQMLSLLGPTDDPDKIGRIAEYEVIGIIGRGGMGVVFKAFDPRLNRFVAIKMLLPHLAASGAARKRFAREGQAAAAVVDDFVLPIYAVAEWKGVPYLVTQFSRGTTLQKRVQSEGPLEVKEILRLGMQTSRGLAAAHAQGLVHRDVKPSNILLDGSVERAMLTDFGLARAVDDASITRTGVIAGTPQYMSPEQARGQSVDARSDLFSLGCVLYFLCTGHPAFRADNSYAVLRLITDEEPRSIREINPDIPAWLCSIVQKLMAKKAEVRYATAMEVAELLEACLAHVSDPLRNPLPDCVAAEWREPSGDAVALQNDSPEGLIPSASKTRPAPRAQIRVGHSYPFLRLLWTILMNDKRILSLIALGLFIVALLLPWPIAAMGRDEPAIIFAGVSILLALTFATMSRRESFSRIVLIAVGGTFGLLVAGAMISVPIYNHRAVIDARILSQRKLEDTRKAADEIQRIEVGKQKRENDRPRNERDHGQKGSTSSLTLPAASAVDKPVELSELQGRWRLVMKQSGSINSKAILSIESNRASVNPKDDLTADMRFVLHLDSQGEPQPIDLEFVLGVTELAQLQEPTDFNGESNAKAIDFYPLRDGKPVALGIIERTEKGFRICMEHAKSVGRPVAFEVAETAGIWELEALSGVRAPTVGVGND